MQPERTVPFRYRVIHRATDRIHLGIFHQSNRLRIQELVAKVKHGGGGVWGQMGMPPHPNLKDDDIRAMIGWVLDHK